MDRWGNVSVTLDFLSDGVKVTSTGADSYIVQKLEHPNDYANKAITISAYIKNISVGAYIQLYSFNGSQYTVQPSETLTSDGICSATMIVPSDTTLLFARLYAKPNGYATYVAAKCEEGNKQTLGWKDSDGVHLFETPNYMETLLRCLRYYYDSGSGTVGANGSIKTPVWDTMATTSSSHFSDGIRFPVPMRAAPAISFYSGGNRTPNKVSYGSTGADAIATPQAANVGPDGFSQVNLVGEDPTLSGTSINYFYIANAEL